MSKVDDIDKMIEEELAQATEVKSGESGSRDKRTKAYDVLSFGTEVEPEVEENQSEELEVEAVKFQDIASSMETNNLLASEKAMTDRLEDSEKADATKTDKSIEKENLDIEWIDCEDLAKKRKKKIKNFAYNMVRRVVMLFALVIFAYAAYELTIIYVESKEATDNSNDTKDMFLVDLDSLMDDYEAPTNAEGETIELVNKGDGKLFVFDYEKMLEYNSDSKGYIRQDNGEYIDNPILQTTDNDYYLLHLANHKKSSVGAIFIDYRIEQGLNAKNCIIYGHNMGDRVDHAMFGSLNWYYYKTGYYKEHPTFDIWIENTRYRYYVYAVFKAYAVDSELFRYEFESDEAFMTYVDTFKKQSKYNFKEAPAITKDSNIITLVTCTAEEEKRLIVQLVRGEELDIYGNPVADEVGTQE